LKAHGYTPKGLHTKFTSHLRYRRPFLRNVPSFAEKMLIVRIKQAKFYILVQDNHWSIVLSNLDMNDWNNTCTLE